MKLKAFEADYSCGHFAPKNFKIGWVDLENETFEVTKINLKIMVTSSIKQVLRACLHGSHTQWHTGSYASAGGWKLWIVETILQLQTSSSPSLLNRF